MVLAGGAGTRFWPASRRLRPKHFVPLVGDRTLFDATLQRMRAVAPGSKTCVVVTDELARLARAELRRHKGVSLLLEPQARNTAAAIVWSAAVVAARDPDGLVGVFPADHHIPSASAFARTVRSAAVAAARTGEIVLIGIEPRRPDTAYGYIRVGDPVSGAARRVRRFHEKPAAARARRFVRDGHYLWNAGMVVARASTILEEAAEHAPEVWNPLRPSLERILAGGRVARQPFARAYRRAKALSFDYAVLERTRRVLAVRGRFRWSDLGSWDALEEHLPRQGGNAHAGPPPAASVDSAGNVIWNTTDKAVALLGIRDLVIVETDDALLVCPKDRAQGVRKVVEALVRGRRRNLT